MDGKKPRRLAPNPAQQASRQVMAKKSSSTMYVVAKIAMPIDVTFKTRYMCADTNRPSRGRQADRPQQKREPLAAMRAPVFSPVPIVADHYPTKQQNASKFTIVPPSEHFSIPPIGIFSSIDIDITAKSISITSSAHRHGKKSRKASRQKAR